MIRIALLSLLSLAAPAFAGGAMTVTYVEGVATVKPAGEGAPSPLSEGDPLHEGDTVQTTPGARLEIAVENGTVIRLGENTKLVLGTAPPSGNAFSAKLLLGNLWTRVHKLVAGESFTIETENGVAGVRGTEFRIEAAQGQPDVLRVYEGAVQVGEHRVEPGHELRFHRGGTAGPRPFDAQSEKGHRFMEWVKAHEPKDGRGQPGSIRRQRRENRLREKRERRRER